jgi:hypothetical protein
MSSPDTTKDWVVRIASRPRWRASPRAMLRCLGLTALIACAGCHGRPSPNSEASDIQFSTVASIANHGGFGAARARIALADGSLTNGEYDEVMAISDARVRERCEVARRAATQAALGRLDPADAPDVDVACDLGILITERGSLTLATEGSDRPVPPAPPEAAAHARGEQ